MKPLRHLWDITNKCKMCKQAAIGQYSCDEINSLWGNDIACHSVFFRFTLQDRVKEIIVSSEYLRRWLRRKKEGMI